MSKTKNKSQKRAEQTRKSSDDVPGITVASPSRFAKQDELSSFIREMMAHLYKEEKKTPPLQTRVEGANGHYFELVSEDGQRSHTVSTSGGPLSFPIRLTVVNGDGEEFSSETNSQDGTGIRYPLY